MPKYSKVRQAKQLASQQRIQVIEVERAVRQAVAAAWNFLTASREIISAAKDQVAAARLALDGVQQEYAAGTRSTQDILDAQAVVVLGERLGPAQVGAFALALTGVVLATLPVGTRRPS